MINRTEAEERRHLEHVKERLGEALQGLGARARRYAADAREQKKYIWENKADLDHVEKASARESAQQAVLTGETVLAAKRRIEKLVESPYFGRFDFARKDAGAEPMPVYVGTHSFADEADGTHLVFDWRAPISTMFYDHEIGEAGYRSPSGDVAGVIALKRQFRIRRGRMEFMLESGLNIMDDVLQEELSRTSDDRMKTIVATIQRDQNAIIRNEEAAVLIIQGVAGSGKTSIALHRVAFLLYRFKEKLSSKDVLIISPNKVFADFISNVLPELGEEQIPELAMEDLANELLERQFKFQTLFEQSTQLVEVRDESLADRVREKSSLEFLRKLEEYAATVATDGFRPAEVRVGRHAVSGAFVEQTHRKLRTLAAADRLRAIAESVEHEIWLRHRHELSAKERAAVKTAVRKMQRNATLRTIYKEFFDWLGKPELFRAGRGSSLEYADVFPMIYLKIRMGPVPETWRRVKHLVVDEMQDYTPVQYAVLERVFSCDKTILGDVNQSVTISSASSADTIAQVFRHAESVKLCKSYRSSFEITRFAQRIKPDADLVAIERHGEEPKVVGCRTRKEELEGLRNAVAGFPDAGLRTLGIVCKTQKQADEVHRAVRGAGPEVHLLTAMSTAFLQGVVVCSAHLAKGLEFDEVRVPEATATNYRTELDRNLLYVACTRAMHRIVVSHAGERTSFLRDAGPDQPSAPDSGLAAS